MAANPLKGEGTFEVEGVVYTIVLDIEGCIVAEDLLNKSMPVIADELASIRFGTHRAVLWAALQAHHANVTLKEAGKLLAQIGVGQSLVLLSDAVRKAFPQPKNPEAAEGEASPLTAAGDGTGKVSSEPGASSS